MIIFLILRCVLAALLAYALGCISVSNLISRHFAGKDIRTMGSGNAGATNVLRNMGLKYAVPTFLGDCGKAVAACLLARLIIGWSDHSWGLFVGGIACVLGHDFPVSMGFKGGKGVSSSLGLLVAVNPWLGLFFIAFATVSNLLYKVYSVVSITTMFLAAVVYTVVDANAFSIPLFGAGPDTFAIVEIATLWALTALMIFMHRKNLVRLAHGEEKKVEAFKK